MKVFEKFIMSSLFVSAFVSAEAATSYVGYSPTEQTSASDVDYWSTAARWSTGVVPNSNELLVELGNSGSSTPKNSTTRLVVDGDYTIGRLLTNWNSREQIISMASNPSNPTATQSLTIDMGATLSSNPWTSVIEMRGISSQPDNILTFQNGTINIVNTSTTVPDATALITLVTNTRLSNTKKILTFGADTIVNSTQKIEFQGNGIDSNNPSLQAARSVVNINGQFNVKDGANYKSVSLAYKSGTITEDGVTSVYENSPTVIVGSTGVWDSGYIDMQKNSVLEIKSGGSMTVNTAASDSNSLTMATGSKFTVGGSFEAKTGAIVVSSGSNLIVDGTFKYNGGFKSNGTVQINGKLTTGTGDAYIQISGNSSFTLNSTARDSLTTSRGIRLDGGNFYLNGDGLSSYSKFWMLGNANKSTLYFNTSTSFDSFCWIANSNVELVFADDVVITLKTLSSNNGDAWSKTLTDGLVSLTLVGYENGQIRVATIGNTWNTKAGDAQLADDLSVIKAAGYEDGSFEWVWHAETNNYWLVGNQIPEPAAMAAIFSAIALCLAAYKRRK